MVKLVEVVNEQGEASADPKDIIHDFLKSDMETAKFEESEVGKTDKAINNFMARMRVYLKYHKLDVMINVSRKKPHIYLVRIDKEVSDDDSKHPVEENSSDGTSTEK